MKEDEKQIVTNVALEEDKIELKQEASLWSWKSMRLKVALALALALSIEGLMRSNINMAMICMVNETALHLLTSSIETISTIPTTPSLHAGEKIEKLQNDSLTTQISPIADNSNNKCENFSSTKTRKQKSTNGDLIITKSEQRTIFAAFYAGGLAIIFPTSYLCTKLGETRLVFYGAVINVIGSLMTQYVARRFGNAALAILRFCMGCGQGVLLPCMSVLIANWFPVDEKSTAIAIATTGNQISVVIAMFLTAELCQLSWLGGWTSAFYIYGAAGIFLCAFWLLLVADSPYKARNIRRSELNFIYASEMLHSIPAKPPIILASLNAVADTPHPAMKNSLNEKNDIPWRKIITSLVVWSTSMSAFSQNFMNVGTVVYLPTYYSNVFGMDLSSNGLMSALPFIVQLLTKILFAAIADQLKSRNIMSHSVVVKLFNLIASLGAGICFILLSFCNCKQSVLAITLAVSAFGLSSGFIPGFNTSVVCIAPRYTASIASFSRLLGQIASVASPYMIGIVVVKGVREEWQIAFFIMAFVLISTGILFQFYGSATIQEWAKVKQNHASEALLEDCEKRINGSIIVLFEASTNNTLEKASDEGNV